MKSYLLITLALCIDCSGTKESVDSGQNITDVEIEDTAIQFPDTTLNVDSAETLLDITDIIEEEISTDISSKISLGKHVMTWYSFQDNTPVNSALTASGRPPLPYISVAVPFRFLKKFGGTLNYGDKLYVDFLNGRTMPNGIKHTGWVQLDDFCGDSGDDSYCFQKVGGIKYPNVDLYIGDFIKSGMDPITCIGPAGNGQELTNLSVGDPGSDWVINYGSSTLGSGKCGDLATAEAQQSCWDYTPPPVSCSDCTIDFCSSW